MGPEVFQIWLVSWLSGHWKHMVWRRWSSIYLPLKASIVMFKEEAVTSSNCCLL